MKCMVVDTWMLCAYCVYCVWCCGVINVCGKYEGIGVEYWMMVALLGGVPEVCYRKLLVWKSGSSGI